MNIIEIIKRMVNAADVKNKAQLMKFINKTPGAATKWVERGKIPDDIVEIVSLKTGYRKEWLLTGTLPEKEPTTNALMMIREAGETYKPGTMILTKQEKNELTMLRYLAENYPIYRQRLSDEIQELYIFATTKTEG